MREWIRNAQNERREAGTYMALARRSGYANSHSHGTLDTETRALFCRLIAEGKDSQQVLDIQPSVSDSETAISPSLKSYLGVLVAFAVGAISANLLQR
jgi:hypothetical protein